MNTESAFTKPQDGFIVVNLTHHEPRTPLGMLLAPLPQTSNSSLGSVTTGSSGDIIVVAGWERLPNGKLGPIQKAGSIRLGYRLIKINRTQITHMSFPQVMALLREMTSRVNENSESNMESNFGRATLNSLTFIPFDPQQSDSATGVANQTNLSKKRYIFTSHVSNTRVLEQHVGDNTGDLNDNTENSDSQSTHTNQVDSSTKKSAPYVEYEISCTLIIRGTGSFANNNLNTTKTWSVWKRYSEFKSLHDALNEAYGWQFSAVKPFPSTRPVSSFFSSLSQNFIENRKTEINTYWQSMLQIEELTDFAQPHRYSRELASFLTVEQYLYSFTSNRGTNVPDISLENVRHSSNNTESSNNYTNEFKDQSNNNSNTLQNKSLFAKNDTYQRTYGTSTVAFNPEIHSKLRIPPKSHFKRRPPGASHISVSIMNPDIRIK